MEEYLLKIGWIKLNNNKFKRGTIALCISNNTILYFIEREAGFIHNPTPEKIEELIVELKTKYTRAHYWDSYEQSKTNL